ncbi:MAG: HTH domain-containing protein [Candidatus Moranbacteria bacterium]|nr:HTH domain-containing protein [Candidatus Moranbacteria bacterium]
MKKIMGNQDRMRRPAANAASIFRDILNIKSEAQKQVEKEIHSMFDNLAQEKRLDQETLRILQNVYFSKKDEIGNERIIQMIETLGQEIRAKKDEGADVPFLTLTADGDLYREPKKKHCYSLKGSGLRLRIIRLLIREKNFLPGKEIAKELRTSYGSVTNAIKEMNRLSQHHLTLPKEEGLIISKSREGYRLNPLYLIAQEKL